VLVPDAAARGWLPRLGVLSVYVQWLALLNAVVLCSMRAFLQGLPERAGFVTAWAIGVAVTALGSAVVLRLDQALDLRLTAPVGEGVRFVVVNAAICALIAAALLRYLFVLERWRERVRAAAKAQVDALQARIRPHFLFNSMNTIASLVRTRPADAERTVEDLSELFRAALGADDGHGTLGDELDLVGRYLDIERLRLGDRLRVEIDVDGAPRTFRLPRLLLQPLVENAIYHGIQPRDRVERVAAVACLADDLDVADLGEQRAHALARQRLVVDDQRSHRTAASGRRTLTVYTSGPGSTRSSARVPKWYSMRARMLASA
jgi:two-component system sensor histidine kinase AlgZ